MRTKNSYSWHCLYSFSYSRFIIILCPFTFILDIYFLFWLCGEKTDEYLIYKWIEEKANGKRRSERKIFMIHFYVDIANFSSLLVERKQPKKKRQDKKKKKKREKAHPNNDQNITWYTVRYIVLYLCKNFFLAVILIEIKHEQMWYGRETQ